MIRTIILIVVLIIAVGSGVAWCIFDSWRDHQWWKHHPDE